MKKINKLVVRQFASVTIAFSLVALLLLMVHEYIFTLIRLQEMRLPYFASFSLLLISSLIIFSLQRKVSILRTLLTGIFVGQICGTISLTIANLFIQNGINRNLMSLRREGIVELVLTDAIFAAILGGWFLGGVGFLFYRFMNDRFLARLAPINEV